MATPVKAFAKQNLRHLKEWSPASLTEVVHMDRNDFFENELSYSSPNASNFKIEFHGTDGSTKVLKEKIELNAGDVIDSTKIDIEALRAFYRKNIDLARTHKSNVVLSLHLKATMMKVSDPIMFGHAVKIFYADVFNKYQDVFNELKVEPNNGLNDVYLKIKGHPKENQIKNDIILTYEHQPPIAMVNSDTGVTNLHAPNKVIVDASVPPVIRDGGKMYNSQGKLVDTIVMIPDRCYATMYKAIINDCKINGKFDVSTMGNVSNVGLMALKAEEYGSHDKTFEIEKPGIVCVVDNITGKTIFQHSVNTGDIWRMCQTRDISITDWIKLAIKRSKKTGNPIIFGLMKNVHMIMN